MLEHPVVERAKIEPISQRAPGGVAEYRGASGEGGPQRDAEERDEAEPRDERAAALLDDLYALHRGT